MTGRAHCTLPPSSGSFPSCSALQRHPSKYCAGFGILKHFVVPFISLTYHPVLILVNSKSFHRSNLRRGVKEKKHYYNSSLKFHPHPLLTLSLLTNLPKRTEPASSPCSPGHFSMRRYLTLRFPDVIGSKTICSFFMSQNQPLLHEKSA